MPDDLVGEPMKEECFTCACEKPEWCRENRRCYLWVHRMRETHPAYGLMPREPTHAG